MCVNFEVRIFSGMAYPQARLMTYSGRMGQQHSNGSFKLVHAHCNKISGVRNKKQHNIIIIIKKKDGR